MSKESKVNFTIGTIGDARHGKTALLATILDLQASKGLADGLANRGLIELDEPKQVIVAEYESDDHYYTHIDCPGSEEYNEKMAANMARMDGAILVVSVPDGVTPQTREHVRLAYEAGIRTIVAYMNKADILDDEEWHDLAVDDTCKLLSEHGFYEPDIVSYGSAMAARMGELSKMDKIDELIQALDRGISAQEG